MKMRLFAMLGVVACAAMTGCVIVGDGGTGGSAGAGVGGAGGAGQGGSGQGGAAGQGGQGGTGGSAMCTTCCGDYVSGLSDTLCAGSAGETTYNALSDCACVTGCKAECGDNLCAMPQKDPTDACTACIQGGACKDAFSACSGDVCP